MPSLRLIIPSSLALLAACSSSESDSRGTSAEADEGIGVDSAAVESDTEALGTSFVAEQASGVVLADSALFRPAGCLSVTNDAAAKKTTYTFDRCSGALGLLAVTGTVVADYAESTANELRVVYTANGLKLNRATVDWSATIGVTTNGDARTMVLKSTLSGTTASGRPLQRANAKTISWLKGGQCITANGQSEGNVSGRDLTTVVEDVKRCAGECPEGGGKITFSSPTGSVEILILDGGRARIVSGTRSAELRLPCSYR